MNSKKYNLTRSENIWGYVFVFPQLIGLAIFTLFPVVLSLYLCFARWDFVRAPVFVGLQNFSQVFNDAIFLKTIINTIYFVLGTIPLTVTVSLALALLTNREIKGINFYKAAYFLPMVTTAVSIAMVWYWMYAPDFGLINNMLGYLGIKDGPPWMAESNWARVAIIIMSSWLKMGYYYIIFLAGLKGISKVYYEAAEIDGATGLQAFKNVTLPMLSPVTFFVFVMLVIDTFNMFAEAFVINRGGPAFATYTLVMYIYFEAFKFFRMGNAAVGSWILFSILGLITYIQFKLSRKLVNYDA